MIRLFPRTEKTSPPFLDREKLALLNLIGALFAKSKRQNIEALSGKIPSAHNAMVKFNWCKPSSVEKEKYHHFLSSGKK